jgi:hypothetical protein
MVAEERVVLGVESIILVAAPFADRTSGLNWRHCGLAGLITMGAPVMGSAIARGSVTMPN